MRWDSGGDREPTEFERARRETVRYHEALYASATLGQAGTWLAKPHRLMADALELVPSGKPVVAYDLGAGIGRHTIPLLRELPDGSDVFAVYLLPSALRSLENAVAPDIRTHLQTRPADLDGSEFEASADLIFALSAIEHLRGLNAVRRLLDRVRAVTKPGGVVAIGIVADRVEVDDHGRRRPALLESAMSTAEATGLLAGAFSDFDVIHQRCSPAGSVKSEAKTPTRSPRRSSPGSRRDPGSAVHLSRGDVRSPVPVSVHRYTHAGSETNNGSLAILVPTT